MIKKFFSICSAVLILTAASGFNNAASASVYTLSSKTPVLIQSEKNISETANKTGDTVTFRTVNTVRDEYGFTLIPSGTKVEGKITMLEQKKRIGRKAEIAVSNFSAVLENGKRVYFTGEIKKASKSRMKRSIVLSVLVCPLFLLMKGAEAELPAGSQMTIYPAANYQL